MPVARMYQSMEVHAGYLYAALHRKWAVQMKGDFYWNWNLSSV